MDGSIFEDAFAPPDLAGTEWGLILLGAVLLRALPLLLVVTGIVKYRRFAERRARHAQLIVAGALLLLLLAVETLIGGLVPQGWRQSGLWSFLWVFAVAWAALTWVQSARATGLRPRWLDGGVLAAAGLLALSFAALMLPGHG